MIIKKEERVVLEDAHVRGGDGVVIKTALINGPEDLNGKGRLFNIMTLNPGCSIGYHEHEGESEQFVILSGTADYDDNGTKMTLKAGDIAICKAGEGHAIANRSDEVLEFIALILYT